MFKKKFFWGLLIGLLLMLSCPVMASAASASPPVKTCKGGTWKTVSGKKYYKIKNKKVTGWAKIGKKTYYFNNKGVMYTGWKSYKGKYYFFDTKKKNSGAMVTGGFYTGTDGKLYYFKSTGASAEGTFSLKTDGVKNYYYARKGNHALATLMWSNKVGGKWYYFDEDGVRHAKWFTMDGNRYYCSPQKGKLEGWNKISGDEYYFTSDGYVEVSQWIPSEDGEQLLYVNDSGAVEKEIQKDSVTSADYGDIIMVGDSRFYQTRFRYGITADNVTFIAKSKMGFDWLQSTAYPQIAQKVRLIYEKNHSLPADASAEESPAGRTAIVLNLGINDLTNSSFYRQFANTTLKDLAVQYDCDLYYVSVNPINTQKFVNDSRRRTPWVLSFNKLLKTELDPMYTYIDTYGYLTSRFGTDYSKITLEDGLHYDAAISRVIFNRIMLEIAPKK